MADPVEVCRTSTNQTQVNTLCLCACAGPLLEKAKSNSLRVGSKGDEVKELHDHLKRFNFDLELSNSRSGTPVDSDDVKNHKWGSYTTRAVRMFALHPQVNTEPESIIQTDGKSLTEAIVNKMCQWCTAGVVSPKNYWEFKQLTLPNGNTKMVDAYGDNLGKGTQTSWHHHIRQIQIDFATTGFAAHRDSICSLTSDYTPDGVWWEAPLTTRTTHFHNEPAHVHLDTHLHDLGYLTRKFQRQAAWPWRMQKDGTQIADASAGDATRYKGSVTGVMDQATGKVLHAWAAGNLHMVINKFALTDLHWPPDSSTGIIVDVGSGHGPVAKLRSDAYDKWVAAARDIAAKNATIEGKYSSSPRGWVGGKQSPTPGHPNANSPYSWHYTGLAVDLGENLRADREVNVHRRYVLEEDGDRFRIWCWVDPQPAAPADPAQDKTQALVQYRNRNIRAKKSPTDPHLIIDASKPSDPAPLINILDDASTKVTVATGWYVDITSILETNSMMRIARHSDWQTNSKAWEWWHYQFAPPLPAGVTDPLKFGDYFQLMGVHEFRLREIGDGWPAHEDIEHDPG